MHNIAILIFDDVEVLDFAGPFEVFSVTSELNGYNLMNVFTVSKGAGLIRAVNGLKVVPDYTIADHPDVDILVVPGGVGTRRLLDDAVILEWVSAVSGKSSITFSVCSGARVLAKLGLLDGIEAITHHEVIPHLRELAPKALIREDVRFVDNGHIMTSGGISAGIDLSLHIVGKLFGTEIRNRTIRYMEYGDWRAHRRGINE